ncbi:probable folate-biopterin transporter 8, chloroplastic [Durio zibethinus]|uniref:Probable folate-biopterin transporter 8, chloroplastic n=1 Tax=Durio zibethinus TaxID=66656 RepID=A0A6P6A635_DURZI|nr:probable folate-biopterin transporter 8, chloroplastic [Durio zibethinus]
MIYPVISFKNPIILTNPKISRIQERYTKLPNFQLRSTFRPSQYHNPNSNTVNKDIKSQTQLKNHFIVTNQDEVSVRKRKKRKECEESKGLSLEGFQEMLGLCGLGYWVQGFRCFPWLALNFHMAHNLNLQPSTLQLIQNSGNLPMVAKPLYGILSDALYIGGAHRIPYICIGVLLQVLSWGQLALIPVASQALPTLMACVLFSNLGASITEVTKDALVTEFGQKHRITGLQSYAYMALATGGILGNLLGGYFLLKAAPGTMFLIFSVLLSLQLAISLSAREECLGLAQPSDHILTRQSILENIRKQLSDLMIAISEDSIFRPLTWIVASIAMVPVLSGSLFCYQTQCLHFDPRVIGMSRVIGQLMLLSLTVLYDRYWKQIPMRKLIGAVQVLYASSLLLDLILVRHINLGMGIPNEVFALCFSGLAETLAQFKVLPFSVLLATLCPRGCEGSLTSFLASALCLSSIISGFWGVGLAALLGIKSGDYSRLPVGILIQFLAALLPLGLIHQVPMSQPVEKGIKRGLSKRNRRNRRIGRVVVGSVFVYRRERESEAQK